MNDVSDNYENNVWSVFFWTLLICVVLGVIVYLIG
jgi:hypothetical protein